MWNCFYIELKGKKKQPQPVKYWRVAAWCLWLLVYFLFWFFFLEKSFSTDFLIYFFYNLLKPLSKIIFYRNPSTWKGSLPGKRDYFDKAIVSDLEFIISSSFLISGQLLWLNGFPVSPPPPLLLHSPLIFNSFNIMGFVLAALVGDPVSQELSTETGPSLPPDSFHITDFCGV